MTQKLVWLWVYSRVRGKPICLGQFYYSDLCLQWQQEREYKSGRVAWLEYVNND